MPNKPWKTVEREIARRYYNARRRGSDTSRDNSGKTGKVTGKSDILYPNACIEVKHGAVVNYSILWNALEQAVQNKNDPSEIAIAHIHKKGQEYDDTWTGITIEDFDNLIANPKYGIEKVSYTVILPRKGKFYNAHIEKILNEINSRPPEKGLLRMAMFQGGIPPAIVLQRLSTFYTWFLDGFHTL